MNWETAAAIAEVLGAAGVIISLLYVAGEVRSNTRALKASAGFDASSQMAGVNEYLSQAILADAEYQSGGESRLTSLIAKIYSPTASLDDLSPTDALLLGFINRGLFQKIEGEYYLYQHGFLDPTQWEGRRLWASGYLSLPIMKAWWAVESTQAVYRPEFVAALQADEKMQIATPDGKF